MQQINLLLAQALDEYERADTETQKEYIQHVKDMLSRYESLEDGMVFHSEYVEASRLFLNQIANA